MSRIRSFSLLAAFLLLGSQPLFASSFAVGSCRPSLKSYPTISAAVAAVPAGSTVLVCPGTYAEQVTIAQPLNLRGVSDGNSDQAIITGFGSMLANITTLGGAQLAAQILVTAGPVNISNLIIDGSGNSLNGFPNLAGIYYGSGASGEISHVTTRNQINNGFGMGIWAENGDSTNDAVSIRYCSIHDFDNTGILTNANVTATLKYNYVSITNYGGYTYGIAFFATGGAVGGNEVSGPGSTAAVVGQGITVLDPAITVGDNHITNWYFGIVDFGGSSYVSNSVRETTSGIDLSGSGATLQSNSVTRSMIGIEFGCNQGTVQQNQVVEANVGMDQVPSGLSSTNTLFNVATIQTAGCKPPAAAAVRAMNAGTTTLLKPHKFPRTSN